jgi:hypothetical protein
LDFGIDAAGSHSQELFEQCISESTLLVPNSLENKEIHMNQQISTMDVEIDAAWKTAKLGCRNRRR